MRTVGYVKATSWGQASSLLKANPKAKAIAGGSDILGWVKDGIEGKGAPVPTAFVDIRTISGSSKIEYSASGGLKIGALATLASIEGHPDVQKTFPSLAKAAGAAASP